MIKYHQIKITVVLVVIFLITIVSTVHAQYISEVLEYKPAPGQLINENPWGTPSAAESIVDVTDGHLTLGAWGGYVVFRFDSPVENHPDNPYGVDFTVFGNPMPDWSEPGIVWVMKDENQNGLPDDTWYQLAGSDYHFSNTMHQYEVTYTNPQSDQAADVPWVDNFGNEGFIVANEVHTQPYYPLTDSFPDIDQNSYSLTGSRIFPVVDSTTSMVKIYQRGFGYADNQFRGQSPYDVPDNPYTPAVENSGGDAFDISWAVDTAGNYIDLDVIDFVKVQNSMQANGGWLGEVSTEVAGAVDVAPNSTITGETLAVVIKDLPPVIKTASLQLEAYAFDHGRLLADYNISWSVNLNGAIIDENDVLHVENSGELEVTATLNGHPEISATAKATVDLGNGTPAVPISEVFNTYPNPFKDLVHVEAKQGKLYVYNVSGQVVFEDFVSGSKVINLAGFGAGLYVIRLHRNDQVYIKKLIKK